MIEVAFLFLCLSIGGLIGWNVILPPRDWRADDLELENLRKKEGES